METVEMTTNNTAGISSVVKLQGKGNYQEWRMQLWRALNSLDDSYWRILTSTEKPKIDAPQPVPSTETVRDILAREENVPASQVTLNQIMDFKRNVIRENKRLELWKTGDVEVFPLLKATLTLEVADKIKDAQSAYEAYNKIVGLNDHFGQSSMFQKWSSWITVFYAPEHVEPEHFLAEWQNALQDFIAAHGEGAVTEKEQYLQFLWAVQHSHEMEMRNWYPDPEISLDAPGFLNKVYEDFLEDAGEIQPWIWEKPDDSSALQLLMQREHSLVQSLVLLFCTLLLCITIILVFYVGR